MPSVGLFSVWALEVLFRVDAHEGDQEKTAPIHQPGQSFLTTGFCGQACLKAGRGRRHWDQSRLCPRPVARRQDISNTNLKFLSHAPFRASSIASITSA